MPWLKALLTRGPDPKKYSGKYTDNEQPAAIEDGYCNPLQEIHGLPTVSEDLPLPGRRECISRIEAQLRRFQLAIIDTLGGDDLEALGSIRKIMTPCHAVWIKTTTANVASIAETAENLGYRMTVLAHAKESNTAWL